MAAADHLSSLLERVAPEQLLVATDFDGTLASIVQRPEDARPLPGVAEALDRLLGRVLRVAVITGRSEAAIRRLLPNAALLVLGDYGRPEPTAAESEALRGFNRRAEELIRDRPGLRLEEKPGSTSIHYRDQPQAGDGLLDEVLPLAEEHGLDARGGRMVVEIVAAGWDKGRALERLMSGERAGGAVYCGDDEGDRRCFELLAASSLPHLSVGVRSAEAAPGLFDACDLVVDGPDEAVAFLNRLAQAVERSPGPGRPGRAPAG